MNHIEANLLHKLLAIFFFPCLIFIKLISPFYKIRLNRLPTERIGHFVQAAGLSLCEKIQGETYKDIYWFCGPTCNTQLEKMVKRVFFVSWCVRCLILANNFFPSLKLVPFVDQYYKQDSSVDQYYKQNSSLLLLDTWGQEIYRHNAKGLYFKTKDIKEAYLPFSHNEEVEAKQVVNSLGIRDSDKFVCLIVRDSEYLSTVYSKYDWTYHSHRDSSIDIYKEAVEALANLGYWVFRMGKKVKEPLNINHPRVIDYANHEIRSDLLDIWLPANAYFSISTLTGLDSVSQAFRRPVVYVNAMVNNDFRSSDHCLWASKHLMWKSEGKLLTLQEALHSSFYSSELYKEKGIKIIDLSSEQIKEVVLEMESRLTGKWRAMEQEELKQSKFMKIIISRTNHGFIHPEARISQKYLEYNPSFLSDD